MSDSTIFTGSPLREMFNANWRKIATPLVVTAGLAGGLSGCLFDSDADVASRNLSTAADQFEINRRIVFYNGITDKYMLVIEGRCSVTVDTEKKKLDVTCKTGANEYKKHFLGQSDNVTWFAEQIDAATVDPYRYRVIFKPQAIIPDIDFMGDAHELGGAVRPQSPPAQDQQLIAPLPPK